MDFNLETSTVKFYTFHPLKVHYFENGAAYLDSSAAALRLYKPLPALQHQFSKTSSGTHHVACR